MKHLIFWLDPISPYAYLAFEQLPKVLQGLSVEVEYRPVLFAGLLKHWGQKGPAEIGPKRDWTYRQVAWLADRHGIALQMPAAHPFNPLALLRLAWACAPDGRTPSRYVCETVLRHVWQGGAAADAGERLQALRAQLAPPLDADDDAVKQRLRQATDDAIARGVFGVPTIEADGRRFWGFDALPMLRAALDGDAWFAGPAWDEATQVTAGVVRRA
jgi:2-hydroxychromene-2-carboxylate isomerase